jgi:radical SAM superfamily enzyme YgiQ (UPF0313 family)
MKVLLINPPIRCSTHEPPLGLAHIASYLELQGFNVEIYDFDMLSISMSEIKNILKRKRPDVVGISFLTGVRFAAFEIAKISKSLGSVVIGGGPHITYTAKDTLQGVSAFDLAVLGEGEITMSEVLKHILEKKKFDEILGIAYRKDGEVIITPPRPLIDNLEILPHPAWHLLPIKEYPEYSLMGARGCWSNCIFCNSPNFWQRKIRHFSVKKVVDWAEQLIREYGKKSIRFRDDYFTAQKKWVNEFCDEIIRRKLNIRWDCLGRVDDTDEDLFRKMRRAGCYKIAFGVEAGSERILKIINKQIKKEKVRNAVKLARKVGFEEIVTFFMIGHPTETIKELEETYNFALELRGDLVSFKPTDIFPGTKLFKIAIQNRILPDSFTWLERDQYKKGFCTEKDVPTFENKNLSREYLEETSKKFFVRSFFDRLFYLNSLRELKYFTITQLGLTVNFEDLLLFLNQFKAKFKFIISLKRKIIFIVTLIFIIIYKFFKSNIRKFKNRYRYIKSLRFYLSK